MNELEKEIYGDLFNEAGDDEFDVEKAMGDMPELEGADDVDAMLDSIQDGETPDEDDYSDLDELEKEFNIAAAASVGASAMSGDDDEDEDDDFEDDDDDLDPDDDEVGDKMLATAVTPDLLTSELTADEFEEFVESGDIYTAANENFLPESFVMEAMDDDSMAGLFTEETKFAAPGKKFKMTKAARFRQLYEISLQIEARLHHDAKYPKMMKVYEIRRRIRADWRRRYHAAAMKRAKKYLRNLMKSNSSGIKALAAKLMGTAK